MATNFFQRWSSRKLTPSENTASTIETVNDSSGVDCEDIKSNPIEVNEITPVDDNEQTSAIPSTPIAEESVIELTIDDVDKVTYDSGVASFMQQQVTKSVKKAALRKLFHSEEFNYISDMDDSTEDFSNMQGLAPEIASQMRGWINTVAETATEALKDDGLSALTPTSSVSDAIDIDSCAGGSTDTTIKNNDIKTCDCSEDDLFVENIDMIGSDDDVLPIADSLKDRS